MIRCIKRYLLYCQCQRTLHIRICRCNDSAKKAVIVITSNRGLAGGYNANVIKLLTKDERFSPDNTVIYAVGKKGAATFSRLGYEIKEDYSEAINSPLFADAVDIGRTVLSAYENGEFGEIYLAYTVFKNTVTHIPTLLKLLPMMCRGRKRFRR